ERELLELVVQVDHAADDASPRGPVPVGPEALTDLSLDHLAPDRCEAMLCEPVAPVLHGSSEVSHRDDFRQTVNLVLAEPVCDSVDGAQFVLVPRLTPFKGPERVAVLPSAAAIKLGAGLDVHDRRTYGAVLELARLAIPGLAIWLATRAACRSRKSRKAAFAA